MNDQQHDQSHEGGTSKWEEISKRKNVIHGDPFSSTGAGRKMLRDRYSGTGRETEVVRSLLPARTRQRLETWQQR